MAQTSRVLGCAASTPQWASVKGVAPTSLVQVKGGFCAIFCAYQSKPPEPAELQYKSIFLRFARRPVLLSSVFLEMQGESSEVGATSPRRLGQFTGLFSHQLYVIIKT
jgi:hypothetical protein